MLEANRSENIEILSYSEVKKVDGYVGNYEVTIEKKPRYITEDCNGCGACSEVCPVYTTNYFDENLGARKAIDIYIDSYIENTRYYPGNLRALDEK